MEEGASTKVAEVEVEIEEAKTKTKKEEEISEDPSPANGAPKPEELVSKAIAPVKRDYLCPPPFRPSSSNDDKEKDFLSDKKNRDSTHVVVKEKKSKRQLKRERLKEQKSALHICPVVAKTGDVNACRYDGNCRFSHDLEAFKALKPADIEGNCPFLGFEEPCPYGLACRFSGTHKDNGPAETLNVQKKSSEVNGLNKDVQRLLWKNKMSFPRADSQLKHLGLVVKDKSKSGKAAVDQEEGALIAANGSNHQQNDGGNEMVNDSVNNEDSFPTKCMGKDCTNDISMKDETQPLKKAKNTAGLALPVKNDEVQTEPEEIAMDNSSKTEVPEEIAMDNSSKTEVDSCLKLNVREKKLIDFRGKLYLAPLTTVGNLPFRRVCKVLGADITCGEMAMCTNLLQGQASEWALLRRHSSEDLFGVQLCGAYPDTVARTIDLIDRECTVDFIDINMGCPIDIVVNKGAGSSLLTKPMRMKNIIQSACGTVDKPLTVKVRTGYFEGRNRIDSLIADISYWGTSAVSIHGRSRQQRYSKLADWDYIYQCARKAPDVLQVLGNGDIFSYVDWNNHASNCPELSTCMIARGALIKGATSWNFTNHPTGKFLPLEYGLGFAFIYPLIQLLDGCHCPMGNSLLQFASPFPRGYYRMNNLGGLKDVLTCTVQNARPKGAVDSLRPSIPWIFTEIKEQRHWDITSNERLSILKDFVYCGLEHWGSDSKGVETTRHFLLEWLSYTHRYIPVGLLDVIPQRLNWRSPSYFGRDDLETLMASDSAADWIRISEMLLGKVPAGFSFAPKHKSNAYDSAENG